MPKNSGKQCYETWKKYYWGNQIITVDVEITAFAIWGCYLNDALAIYHKGVVL